MFFVEPVGTNLSRLFAGVCLFSGKGTKKCRAKQYSEKISAFFFAFPKFITIFAANFSQTAM
jgi:hypothetical protein